MGEVMPRAASPRPTSIGGVAPDLVYWDVLVEGVKYFQASAFAFNWTMVARMV